MIQTFETFELEYRVRGTEEWMRLGCMGPTLEILFNRYPETTEEYVRGKKQHPLCEYRAVKITTVITKEELSFGPTSTINANPIDQAGQR